MALDIALYKQYSEKQAAEILGISLATLQRARKAGRITYIQKGERLVAYFGFHLVDYLLNQQTGGEEGCQNTPTESSGLETSGSVKGQTAQRGAERGTTTNRVKLAENLLALRTGKKPSQG